MKSRNETYRGKGNERELLSLSLTIFKPSYVFVNRFFIKFSAVDALGRIGIPFRILSSNNANDLSYTRNIDNKN